MGQYNAQSRFIMYVAPLIIYKVDEAEHTHLHSHKPNHLYHNIQFYCVYIKCTNRHVYRIAQVAYMDLLTIHVNIYNECNQNQTYLNSSFLRETSLICKSNIATRLLKYLHLNFVLEKYSLRRGYRISIKNAITAELIIAFQQNVKY